MRTKTLLLTAALGAVGLSTSMAQTVFSVNAVGYVNVKLPKNFSIVANPLDNKANGNKIPDLFKGVPDGTTVYKYDNATKAFTGNGYDGLADTWDNPAQTLVPGEGAFILSPSEYTVTFVGDVPQGTLTTHLPKGLALVGSQVPQSANLDGTGGLGWPTEDGDTIYFYRNGGYQASSYDALTAAWDTTDGKGPSPAVGEGFWSLKANAKDWVRNFSVNP